MMIRLIAQIFFFYPLLFPILRWNKTHHSENIWWGSYLMILLWTKICTLMPRIQDPLRCKITFLCKCISPLPEHHLYIHHRAWRRGFGVLIVNQPLQNKLILQVLLLLFLCHCNALTDIKWTYREIMLELKIAAFILSNLHTVRFLNSQIRIQAFALVTEPNISTRSSQSWAISGQLFISAFHGPLHWLSSPIFLCLSFVPLWWHPTKSSLVFNIYRHKSPLLPQQH